MVVITGYEILEQIYESSNSVVYRGRREEDNQPIILKVLKQDCLNSNQLTRYKQEYEITSNLESQGIIKVYDLQNDNYLTMILEDFGGESLRNLLSQRKFNLVECLEIACQITDSLAQIHAAQVIHKDINPSNIVFNPVTKQLKIIDFGISTRLGSEHTVLSSPNALEGTLAYISPEQTGRMNRSLDYRADFYSLGVTLYELFTHELPFTADDAMELIHCHLAKEPVSPHEFNPKIPRMVSEIIMKLMAKTAEERYQSIWGIKADLETCLLQLQSYNCIIDFDLGQEDISHQFNIPQKLYGREQEISTLLTAFERVVNAVSKAEIILVKGYSGIGKSALVKEIYQPITRQRGYFISGKFDQFQRNIPYSAVVKALSGLVKQLLTESEVQLQEWKQKLLAAIESNAQIIIDVIPEVELIIGKQAAVEELSGSEAQNRFNSVFKSFIRVLCQPEHPLVLFLDDLQWADSASLQLIELMMTDDKIHHLLLIGSYRDNEVDAAHPLALLLERLEVKVSINQINLTPLNQVNVTELIAETLHRDIDDVKSLARLVSDKTAGNPFFINQSLYNLYSENLIYFHVSQGVNKPRWEWDISQIEAMDITDNVVDLMVSKLIKLPKSTQKMLRLAACIGNRFSLNTLAIVGELSVIETFEHLTNAIKEGFILPTSGLEFVDEKIFESQLVIYNFIFLHDRVQQAAYSLIAEYEKQAVHLQIGWLLYSNFSQQERIDNIFELVDHLNLGRELIIDDSEKIELIKLNIFAAKKARDAIAYGAAETYLKICVEELPADSWLRFYELTLDIYKLLAEVEYLNGNFIGSESLINLIIEKAKTDEDKADIHILLTAQYTMLGKFSEAIASARKGLQYLGVDLPEQNLESALEVEVIKANKLLEGKEIASLINQPDMIIPDKIISTKLLISIEQACYLSNQKLYRLVVIKTLNLSLEYGSLAESVNSYSTYGTLLGSIWGEYQKGYEFGKLALSISEKYHNLNQKCKGCFLSIAFQIAWVKYIKFTNKISEEGFKAGIESGDLQYCGYILAFQSFNIFHEGINIEKQIYKVDKVLQFVSTNVSELGKDIAWAAKLCLMNLNAETKELLGFDSPELSEAEYLQSCWERKSYMPLFDYYTLKSFILYLYNKPVEALEAVIEAEKLQEFGIGLITIADHNFYQSLILTALYSSATFVEQKQYWQQLERNQTQMKIWADNCEANFLHKYLIIEAEIARISGNKLEAMELYDLAIASASTYGFIQNEALANELAANFWLGMNKEDFAQIYLRKAYNGYQNWGAKFKVADLENQYSFWLNPQLAKTINNQNANKHISQTTINQNSTTTNFGETLDIHTVLKASQTISNEILLAELIDQLMKIVIENAGAQTGSLIFVSNGELIIEAVMSINVNEQVEAKHSLPITAFKNLPISVINYVARTHSDVLLDEANQTSEFESDSYFIKQKPKSVLCIPILHQGQLIAILYLENNLISAAFPSERLKLLKLICSQAAISIKNASLYNTLEQKVAERTQQLSQALENLRAAQKQLVESEKMAALGILVAGVAHEINTPVGTSITAASTLKDETTTFNNALIEGKLKRSSLNNYLETASESTDLILNNLNRASDLIQSFKQVAVDSSHLEKREFAIKPYIEEISNSLAPKLKNTALSLTVEGENDIDLETYPGALAQIVTNLVINSLNHAYQPGEKGQLRFQITQEQGKVTIQYSDDGCGIPPENLSKIFEPFFTTARNQGGTGLGLHIVYNLVTQKLQGKIDVKSEANLGTIFIIALPKVGFDD
ncbi:serine/threonine protein kinase with two-component sensor domain [Calothrix parasitica NIES-267]|uniref:histidine kinase n=1 Tax=Calothrix parasitica NIES-267 TaxID=1973488 RepID=A0A1Z4LQA8_9CYAN|nr:serine/threonine protein kinase with two-component sensor domain [Calothrix parasitica NIES-267]